MKPKIKKKIKDESDLFFFAKMNATSLAAFSMVVFVIGIFSAYTVGFNSGLSSQENIGAQAAYHDSVSECVVYSDEVIISNDNCTQHVDCAPNGICLLEYEKCAYFVN